MNEQSTGQTNVTIQDNLSLMDGENENQKSDRFSVITAYLRNTKDKVRRFFIKKNEKSYVVMLLEKLYYSLLSLKTKILGAFLLSFSITAMLLTMLISPTIGSFISNKATFDAVIILLAGLMFSLSGLTVEDLINGSLIISPLNIVYSQPGIISSYKNISAYNEYSSPVFIGIILGILSIIFPSFAILGFLLSLLYVLFIFNRPECGILMIVLFLPLFGEFYVILFSFITLFSLIYKYFLGKRHISVSFVEVLIFICVSYIILRFINADNHTATGFVAALSYILFFAVYISTSNLVRSTSMYRRSLLIIISFTRMFTLILPVYYVLKVFFGFNVSSFLVSAGFSGIDSAITHLGFIAPFIVMAVPLNLSYILSTRKRADTIKGIIYILILFACAVLVESKVLMGVILVSCILILFFYRKRTGFLLICVPFILYGFDKLINIIPTEYKVRFIEADGHAWDTFNNLIRSNAAFGEGFSKGKAIINNTALKILGDVGIVGALIFTSIFICVMVITIRSLLKDKPYISKVKFFTIGQIIASVSFTAICMTMNSAADMRMTFLFSVIFSLAYTSTKCYEADYIDEFTVREYLS